MFACSFYLWLLLCFRCRIQRLIIKAIGKEPKVWIKTPRTEETRAAC